MDDPVGGEKLVVIDFGSQFSYLIVSRLREIGIYTEIIKYCDLCDEILRDLNCKGFILSGGPNSVFDEDAPSLPHNFFDLIKDLREKPIPVLGICYGLQYIVQYFGGVVNKTKKREFGEVVLSVDLGCDHSESTENTIQHEKDSDEILQGGNNLNHIDDFTNQHIPPHKKKKRSDDFNDKNIRIIAKNLFFNCIESTKLKNLTVWMSHEDQVIKLPSGFVQIAKSETCKYAAIYCHQRNLWGIQFHPEVTHTLHGITMLENFAKNICGIKALWNLSRFKQIEMDHIKNLDVENSGKIAIICSLSGGVDSAVAAALVSKSINCPFFGIFVDTGLMRHNEAQEVQELLRNNLQNVQLITVDASKQFLSALEGVVDPEEKRKIIGKVFIEVFEAEKLKLNLDGKKVYLLQGTLYPDIIESSKPSQKCDQNKSGNGKMISHTIKTHHNVGGIPDSINMEILEPLKNLFKDEVKRLGRELALSEEILNRHPFPGPGLAIRISGEVNEENLDILRRADDIFISEIRESGLYTKISQALVVLLTNAKSTGVMGDKRTYQMTAVLRSVETQDFMTAEFSRIPHDILSTVSRRIINEVHGINRVCYDISSKPPATIEWE